MLKNSPTVEWDRIRYGLLGLNPKEFELLAKHYANIPLAIVWAELLLNHDTITPNKFTDPVIDASIRSVAFLRFMSENSALKRLSLRRRQQLLQLWRKLLDCPGKNTR